MTYDKQYSSKHMKRYEKTITFIRNVVPSATAILDVGGYDGTFVTILKKHYPSASVYVTDMTEISSDKLDQGICFKKCGDLSNNKLPFESESFDMVTCLEVIEHLYNPDNLLLELNRVLKKNGILILSTPNLASWSNRILVALGYFPRSMSISYESERTGKRDLFNTSSKTIEQAKFDYHCHIYTFSALKILLQLHGFKIIRKKYIYGYSSLNLISHILNTLIEKVLPSLSQTILVAAMKIKNKY